MSEEEDLLAGVGVVDPLDQRLLLLVRTVGPAIVYTAVVARLGESVVAAAG